MKTNKKLIFRVVSTFLIMCMLCVGISAIGSTGSKMMTATFNNVKIVVNGIEVTPTDAGGNAVEPFISEGTTYLPVRAIANALGLEVKWDGETKTVYLGEIPGQEDNWVKKFPPFQWTPGSENEGRKYDGSDPRQSFSVLGKTHTVGYTFRSTASYHSSNLNHVISWNTDTKYRSMTFTIGGLDGNRYDCTIDVYLDGEYSTTYNVEWDKPAQTITIPLNYTALLRLEIKGEKLSGYGMYDISFAE